MLLVVNYHYINEQNYPFGGIHPIRPTQFVQQIEILGQYFEFVSLQQVINAVVEKNDRKLPAKACLITMDDGLREQFEVARPLLKSLGVPAAFFVNPGPVINRKVALVHKIHLLRAYIHPRQFENYIKEEVSKMLHIKEEITDEILEAQYPYDEPEVRRLKYILNFVLPQQVKDIIITTFFERTIGSEANISEMLYMQPKHWRELAAEGSLGTHGLDHLPLASLDEYELKFQIYQSIQILRQHTGLSVQAISYPYGGIDAVSNRCIQAAQEAGLLVGFTMERAFNQTLKAPLLLARVDTNDVPGGKSPLFIIKEQKIQLLGNLTWSRSLWYKEDTDAYA